MQTTICKKNFFKKNHFVKMAPHYYPQRSCVNSCGPANKPKWALKVRKQRSFSWWRLLVRNNGRMERKHANLQLDVKLTKITILLFEWYIFIVSNLFLLFQNSVWFRYKIRVNWKLANLINKEEIKKNPGTCRRLQKKIALIIVLEFM